MDFTELYAQKKMTAAQAAALVKSGDWVDYGWAVNTPVAVDAERGPRQALNARPAIMPHINPQHFIFIIIIFLRFYVYSFLS